MAVCADCLTLENITLVLISTRKLIVLKKRSGGSDFDIAANSDINTKLLHVKIKTCIQTGVVRSSGGNINEINCKSLLSSFWRTFCVFKFLQNFLCAHHTELQTLLSSPCTVIGTDADCWTHCSENRTFCGCNSKHFAWHIHLKRKEGILVCEFAGLLLGHRHNMQKCRCKLKLSFV